MSQPVVIIINIIGLVAVAGIGLWTAYIARGTHTLINSRMTELLELTRKSALAQGVKEESERLAKGGKL